MSRIKLFSKPRKKLFSSSEFNGDEGMIIRQVVCQDCGHTMETGESTSAIVCPNCGGKRFNISLFPASKADEGDPDVEFDKIKEAEEQPKAVKKEFSERRPLFSDTPYEVALKTYSGQTLTNDEFEKIFSDNAEDMFEKGFAVENEEGGINIVEGSYGSQKLFSKLIISITKTLELDPAIMKGEINKEELIDKLEDHMPEKSIMILKKAHDILPVQHQYSDEGETWLQDSKIIPDLTLEYDNQSFPIEQFIKIIRERYDDAPENILDLLLKEGVIMIEGNSVTIISKRK